MTDPSLDRRGGRLRDSTIAKNVSIAARASCPPSNPRHVMAHRADQLVADVDRHQRADEVTAVVVGPMDEQGLDVGQSRAPSCGFVSTRRSHDSSGSSDSVAPAGLG